jgi:hypothetical protein
LFGHAAAPRACAAAHGVRGARAPWCSPVHARRVCLSHHGGPARRLLCLLRLAVRLCRSAPRLPAACEPFSSSCPSTGCLEGCATASATTLRCNGTLTAAPWPLVPAGVSEAQGHWRAACDRAAACGGGEAAGQGAERAGNTKRRLDDPGGKHACAPQARAGPPRLDATHNKRRCWVPPAPQGRRPPRHPGLQPRAPL